MELTKEEWDAHDMFINIYIAGKVTGEPFRACFLKFLNAMIQISSAVDIDLLPRIVNPLTLPGIVIGISHKEAMKICLAALKHCTHIYMLRDWRDSDGAKEELAFAIEHDLTVIYEEEENLKTRLRARK